MSAIEFTCACGACSVKAEGAPVMQLYCHCDDCQASSGAPFVARAIYPKGSVALMKGSASAWVYKTTKRTFCAACGVTLFVEPPGDRVVACNASLFPAGAFQPQAHVQCQNTVVPLKDGLPHYKSWPPQFGGSGELVDW